ncbi:MAG: hypothetical protein Q8859_07115 [Bacteroidota bacterium]|nr:hypothetical protein [Bacteroidota bacterium]
MGKVIISEVKTKKDLRKFIYLPEKIHQNNKNWLPPLYTDEWKIFDPKKNPAYEHCDTILFLAEKDGKPVGRIMGIINRLYNNGHHENNGRFCFIECYDDEEVYDALIASVENWAREKGMDNIVGPLAFSDKDPQGFLVYGYDDPVTVMVTNCNYPYMVNHIERNGYLKKVDLVQYRLDVPKEIPQIYKTIYERTMQRGYEIIEFTKTRQVKPFVKPIFDLINATYRDIYGFSPLTEEEANEFAERFLPILDANHIKVVKDKDGKLVAFIVSMPDISEGIKKAKGRLFPFGFIKILRAFKTTKQLTLLLGCVNENIRNAGLSGLLAYKIFESAQKCGLKIIDSHLVMEENHRMRAVLDRADGVIYKKYRIFEKKL